MKPKSQFGFVLRDTEESNLVDWVDWLHLVDWVDFGEVAFSVETVMRFGRLGRFGGFGRLGRFGRFRGCSFFSGNCNICPHSLHTCILPKFAIFLFWVSEFALYALAVESVTQIPLEMLHPRNLTNRETSISRHKFK